MKYIVVGLGNPGEEYEATRHNVGRMAVARVAELLGAGDWRDDKKSHAQQAQGKTSTGDTVVLVLPETYMNRSGTAVAPLVPNAKQAERLIVVHDDIDLPQGTLRIVFDRGAGGHNGVRSIEKALKTRAFVRVRIGVIPTTPGGKMKKPGTKDGVHDFLLQPLRKKEVAVLEESAQRAAESVLAIMHDGREAAMCAFNRAS